MPEPTRLTPAQERHLLQWGVAITPIFEDAPQFGDIALVDTPTGRDLQLCEGVDNLHQQIRTAIATALGADPLNLGYGFGGFDAIAQEATPVLRRERLRFAVLSVLQADPRVRHVLRVLIGAEIAQFHGTAPADTPGELRIEAQFTIGNGETISLAVGPLTGGIL